jgi:hypothetical protein
MADQEPEQQPGPARGVGRRSFLLRSAAAAGGTVIAAGVATPAVAASAGAGPVDPSDSTAARGALRAGEPKVSPLVSTEARKKTLIGIGYETWFMPGVVTWNTAEATPVLGRYRSDDPKVIRQHAEWISGAGFDYIMVDWSNNLGDNWTNGQAQSIIAGTDAVFREYAELPRHPKIVLLLGADADKGVDTDHFRAQIAEIKAKYLKNPAYRAILQEYQGKPLIGVYYALSGNPPTWDDPDFTVRYMTGLHETTGDPAGVWSWIDRAPLVSGPVTQVSKFDGGSSAGGESKNGSATSVLAAGHTFGQSFTFAGSALTKVSALLATYGSSTTGVTMTLYSGTPEGTLTKVAAQTFTDMADNSWQEMTIDAAAPAGPYYLEVSDPLGTPVWWQYSGSDLADVGGTQYVDRAKQPAGQLMTFTFSGTESGPGGLNGWQTGAGWGLVHNAPGTLQAPENVYPSTKGASAPGTLTSPAFEITGTFLTFYAAGSDKLDNSGTANYFLLKDASTGKVLRREHTPNSADYFVPIMWDVRELAGRKVVFEADNGNTATGWMAVCNINQQTAEFSVATMGMAADAVTPGLTGWSSYQAKPRMSGATLVWYMQEIFAYQPDVMLIQQWNEFGHDDQYDVTRSNDIEPTTMSGKDGPASDGWGTYYLDLVREIIGQYRQGAAYPSVRLDTRYP